MEYSLGMSRLVMSFCLFVCFFSFCFSDGNITGHVPEGSEATKPNESSAFLSAWLTSAGPDS